MLLECELSEVWRRPTLKSGRCLAPSRETSVRPPGTLELLRLSPLIGHRDLQSLRRPALTRNSVDAALTTPAMLTGFGSQRHTAALCHSHIKGLSAGILEPVGSSSERHFEFRRRRLLRVPAVLVRRPPVETFPG